LSKLLKYTQSEYTFTPAYENMVEDEDDIKKRLAKLKAITSNTPQEPQSQQKRRKKKRVKPILSNQIKLQIAHDIAEAMYYLHTREKPIIHRDLKSMNVLLSSDLTCAICDFGFASMRNQNSGISGLKGTAGWMAPEMFKGGSIKKGAKCDVYSFGMILYELLTHQVPYYHIDNQFQVTNEVLQGIRPTLDQSPKDVITIDRYEGNDKDIVKALLRLHKECTEKDVEDRPDFIDIIYELQNVPVSTTIQYTVDPEAAQKQIQTGITVFRSIQEAINAVPNNDEQRRIIDEQCGIVLTNTLLRQSNDEPDMYQNTPTRGRSNSRAAQTPKSFVKSTKELYSRQFVDLEELKERARALLFSKDSTTPPSTPDQYAFPSPRTGDMLDIPERARRRFTLEFSSSPLNIENTKKQTEKLEEIRENKAKEKESIVKKGRLIDKRTGIPYSLDDKGRKIVLSNSTLKPPLIKVRPGVYRESVIIDRDIQLIASGATGTVNGVVIEQSISQLGGALMTIKGCTNVTLQNFTFLATNTTYKCPVVKVTGASQSIAISNCKFNGVQLEIDDRSESVVNSCSIRDCTATTGGLYIHNSSRGHYFDNTFCDNTFSNITISHNADPIIEFNDVFRSKSIGIIVMQHGRGWITRNEIYDNDSHGIMIHTNASPLVEYNEIDHNGGRGIDCGILAAGIIRHNNISLNEQFPQLRVLDDSVTVEDNNNILEDPSQIMNTMESANTTPTSNTEKKNSPIKRVDSVDTYDSDEYTYTDDSDSDSDLELGKVDYDSD
jgi:serine/threonine protein kinase